jgi:hypothetical protein
MSVMIDKPDPTKEPEFQKVIRHFVTTPHKPHEPLGKKGKANNEPPPSPGPRAKKDAGSE